MLYVSKEGDFIMTEEKNASLRAKIAIKTIHFVMNLPYSGVDTMLETGSKLALLHFPLWVPKGFNFRKIEIEGLPIEILESRDGNQDKVILQFHGGGFVIGLLDIYRRTALQYAKVSDSATVINIDYRTAPSHVYPAALEDAEKDLGLVIRIRLQG